MIKIVKEEIEIDIDDEMLVEKMTQYYINQFVFKISEISIESTCEQFLEKLKNNYLYFDIDKKKHVSKKESIWVLFFTFT